METSEIQSILYIVLLVSAIALCISLIFYLKQITNSFVQIEKDVKDFTDKIKPLIAEASEVNNKLNNIASLVNNKLEVVGNIVDDVKDRADEILEFEEKFRRGIEEPAMGLVKSLSAISNGVNTFWKTYKNKH